MSGALQAVFQNQRSFGPPPPGAIGSSYEGGFYAGEISVAGNGVASHYLVVAPVSSGETTDLYKDTNESVSGADSVIDGPQNTADMVAAGSSTNFPAAHFCNNASIGGFTDWYLPAKNELEVCYYNLKPNAQSNDTGSGTNTNAVPSRGANYTAGTPTITSAADFQTSGAEDFNVGRYWSSTEYSVQRAWTQYFYTGLQYYNLKNTSRRIRCIRRVAI